MMSDKRGLWHADMIRSAEARPRGANYRRPWPRIDQVALRINRRWQERGTWLARVGASSIASRYSLWIRGIPLFGNGSRRRVPCCPCLESHLRLGRPQCKQLKNKSKNGQQTQPGIKTNGPVKVKPTRVLPGTKGPKGGEPNGGGPKFRVFSCPAPNFAFFALSGVFLALWSRVATMDLSNCAFRLLWGHFV